VTDSAKQVRLPGSEAARAVTRAAPAQAPGLATSTLFLVLLWGLAIAVGRILGLIDAGTLGATTGGLLVGAAVLVAAPILFRLRSTLFAVLTSLPFAVVVLTALLLCTAGGTLILQKAEPQEYAARYGPELSRLLLGAGFNDVFHSAWFNELVGILALSLLLTVMRVRPWEHPVRYGHLMAHLGVVVILAGGVWGNLFGLKGRIDLREGESTDIVRRTDGVPPEQRQAALGFTFRLDDFEVDHYEDLYRLRVYEQRGERWVMAESWPAAAGERWQPLGGEEARFRVTGVYPDYEARREVQDVEAGHGHPMLSLTLEGAAGPREVILIDGVTGRDQLVLPAGGPLVRFAWLAPDPETIAETREGRPARHTLTVRREGSEASETLEVQPGGRYTLEDGTSLQVQEFLPDFTYDIESKRAYSRSGQPNNPGLQVVLAAPGGTAGDPLWLFAKMPGFSMGHGAEELGLEFEYRYEAGEEVPGEELLVVGSTAEVLRLERGRLAERLPLEQGLAGLPLADVQRHASALEVPVPTTRSDEWKHPAVMIEYADAETAPMAVLLDADHTEPLRIPGRAAVLVFERRSDDIKEFASRVTVLEGGQPVAEQIVRVNEPLSHAGFMFYQSNYRPEEPDYSGFLVVKDPGLTVVWIGFVMLCLGVTYIYTVRSWILRRAA
jgi:hypothetical protein